jgi:hypothetical protein
VFSRKRSGVIYNRRIERDEQIARKNRDNGKKGGSPSLCNKTEIDKSVNRPDKARAIVTRSQKPEARKKKEKQQPGADAPIADDKYFFQRGVIKLTKADYDQWQKSFPHVSLGGELESLAEWAGGQKKWFPAVAGALRKRNQAAYDRRVGNLETPDFSRKTETAPNGQKYDPRTHRYDEDFQAVTRRMGPCG